MMAKSTDRVRVIYSEAPGRCDAVEKNPGKVFAVIGPFDDFTDRAALRDALEMIVRGHNYEQRR